MLLFSQFSLIGIPEDIQADIYFQYLCNIFPKVNDYNYPYNHFYNTGQCTILNFLCKEFLYDLESINCMMFVDDSVDCLKKFISLKIPADSECVYRAIEYNNIQCVKLLVDYGAIINANCILYATSKNYFEILDIIIEKIKQLCSSKENDIHYLYNIPYPPSHTYYTFSEQMKSAILDASNRDDMVCLKFLIDKGGIPDNISILRTAGRGNIQLLKFLLDNGGKPDNCAILAAAAAGNNEIIKFLLSRGARISDDAVEWALNNKHYDTVSFLLDLDAKVPINIKKYYTSDMPKKIRIKLENIENDCVYGGSDRYDGYGEYKY